MPNRALPDIKILRVFKQLVYQTDNHFDSIFFMNHLPKKDQRKAAQQSDFSR